MTRSLLACTFITGSLLLAAQTAPNQAAQAPSSPGPPQSTVPIPTLRASSRIVVVDVVVTDKQQNPVHNLKDSDFSLLEKGQPQTIAHFEEHTAISADAVAKLLPVPKLDPGIFTNYSTAPADGALNVLLLDGLNTPMKDQTVVRQEMLKYLKSPRPGTRMAIFGLTQQLHMLQGFTSDPDVLRDVVSGKKGTAKASPLMDNAVNGDTVAATTPTDTMIDMLGNDPTFAEAAAQMQQFEAEQQSFLTMLRTRYTLDALNLLGRYLSGFPGRKNLIWFSASFPVNILPDLDLPNPFAVQADMQDEFRDTINLLARSQVSVYPIDARGLMTSPTMDAANDGAKYAKNPRAMGKDEQKFFSQTAEEHGVMMQMAEDTGGRAFVNTNALKESVDRAIAAGSNYYTLTYTPTNRDWRGDYRKIEVKLSQQGFNLAYRRGYYADDPDAAPTTARRDAATAPTAFAPMHTAMQWGGPDPVEIIFQAKVVPSTGMPEPTLAPGTTTAPKVNGPYKRYDILLSADPKAITFAETPKGAYHLDVEFLTFVYNSEGFLTASTGKRVLADLTPDQYNGMRHSGVRYRQEVSVPVKGEFYLRIGVHDLASDRVGAIEVPVAAINRLPPLSAQTPAK